MNSFHLFWFYCLRKRKKKLNEKGKKLDDKIYIEKSI